MLRSCQIIFALISALALSSPVRAQTTFPQRATPRTPEEVAEVQKEFLKSLKESLLQSCEKTASISNSLDKAIACECYADAYIKRYDPDTLLQISTWAYDNDDKTSIIVLMLNPERKLCRIP